MRVKNGKFVCKLTRYWAGLGLFLFLFLFSSFFSVFRSISLSLHSHLHFHFLLSLSHSFSVFLSFAHVLFLLLLLSLLLLCTHRNGINMTNDYTNEERQCTTMTHGIEKPVLGQIKPQAPLLVALFRQCLKVSALRPNSPGSQRL